MSEVAGMHRLIRSGVVLVLLASTSIQAAAQSSSDEGAIFLLLPLGAGAVAMGRAVTAMPGQESAFWNPAGLASTRQSKAVLLRGDVAAGISTAVSALFARPGIGTLGISYLLRDEGDQEHKDIDNNLNGTVSLRNHLAIASAAATVLSGLDVGVNFKVVQFRRSCRGLCSGLETTATGYAIDAGLQWMPSATTPLRVGAMVAHVGPRFQQENASQADPLPTRIRVAAAYDVLRHLRNPDLKGWVTLEIQDRPAYAGGTSLFIGSEWMAGSSDALFLRAGYGTNGDQPSGTSMGLGLRFERFDISVAKSLAGSTAGIPEPVDVSFSVVF
jgi:hypothetical protein